MSCLIGYTTSGQYSYTLGKGLAIGSITLRGLLKLHEIDRRLVSCHLICIFSRTQYFSQHHSQDRRVKLLVLVKGVQSRLCRAGQAEVLY